MDPEIASILLVAVTHVLGAVVLVGLLVDEPGSWKRWWPRDDDGGARPSPGPPPRPPSGNLPLPDAAPSRVRLRGPAGPGRSGRPERRPAREPGPVPARRGR